MSGAKIMAILFSVESIGKKESGHTTEFMKKFKNYIEKNSERFLNELFELLRIPSISALKENDSDTRLAAELIKKHLLNLGLNNCEICETKGHPIVYGEKIIDYDLPTILVYGHYDVQPVDPLDLWDQDPFQPYIKKTEIHPEGAIFARGACDDKGQMFMHIKALEVMLENGDLPCNVKFMIEGEEEVGSDNLELFVKNNKEKLSNDFFKNLLDMNITWKATSDDQSIFEGRDRNSNQIKWTGTRVDLIFGSNSELRSLAEVYASNDSDQLFLNDFVSAWTKVMNLDRF